MRKVKDVLELKWGKGQSNRDVGKAVKLSASTVGECVGRATRAGLTWPLPDDLDEEALEARLYPPPPPSDVARPSPVWEEVHRELRGKHVTRQLVWEEYAARHLDTAYGYSQFCQLYRAWLKDIDVCMRQTHVPGERVFVDFAGDTIRIIDPNGDDKRGEVFIGVLGASNYTYVEICRGQDLPSWVAAHTNMFAYFDGTTEIWVPDNLKSAVTKPCRYEPLLNRTYEDLADHYGAVVIPARVRKPRDKAKAENGVLIAERWILARLRKHRFFSIAEANEAVRDLLIELNERPFQKLSGCRRSWFEAIERPALLPLPEGNFEHRDWSRPRAGNDYHVDVEGHFYSVPYLLANRRLEARYTRTSVEIFDGDKRVAVHVRSFEEGGHTTEAAHMPKRHRVMLEEEPDQLTERARRLSEDVGEFVDSLIRNAKHPKQGARAALGVLRLGKKYGNDRLDAACRRATAGGAISYHSVLSILDKRLDQEPAPESAMRANPIIHENVRGRDYYDQGRPVPTAEEATESPPRPPSSDSSRQVVFEFDTHDEEKPRC